MMARLFFSVAITPCKILKCNSEFWSATSGSHVPASDDVPEFCAALRTYALCTRRTARTCRGDLAYHSAVHGIEDLMNQHNCSKDGPTSQPRLRTLPPAGDSQERSDSPEICHYEKSFHKHSAAPNYTHCGLFGDPHLRTFTDHFQTCKVQGAWPLIDNNYLNVQVTNTPVLPGSAATATSKVRVYGKGWPGLQGHTVKAQLVPDASSTAGIFLLLLVVVVVVVVVVVFRGRVSL
ncbi:repulsive guidance molecule A-like [Alexandromys fortis]|uniref:repulsive guidance molecule A-like n=1 Tax=Alexandromys fortis TaxID=100897 RepID=UPI00215278CA|nr:repulsive guidance molecule A-like [Microtus fortis]